MTAPHDIEFDQVAPPEQRRKAARAVATLATDAEDCAQLLAMLGLTAADGLSKGRPARKRRAA
ncbi:hypothetical protein [Labedaea rhizosphaerae]|uniref:Uncharacterized protein n=1 Tax=Labedaea rhizosphaerae TaxID=598644 RepID=A0A4R6SIF8_LABRH|nr:hypothetical protein [Labedaea rhizosphaerae]TDQ01453.1 hypothetical protein EV186_1021321 [Labedaea rhizosphaerae]